MFSPIPTGRKLTVIRVVSICLYAAVVLSAILVSFLSFRGVYDLTDPYSIGSFLSLIAFPIFALQPVLAARLKILDRIFGLDRILAFHKSMAILAGCLIIIHPLLLAVGMRDPSLLLSFNWPWFYLVGKGAILVIVLIAVSSLGRKLIGLGYERWRGLHNITAVLLVVAGFLHSYLSGTDLTTPAIRVIWIILLAGAVTAYVFHKIINPIRQRKHRYTVTEVRQEAHDVWTIRLHAPGTSAGNGAHTLPIVPGQFQFLTLLRGRGLPKEEHPFTISSAGVSEPSIHSATIKASGDFTRTIESTVIGDTARIQAPYGRFSYTLYPEEKLLFIAGGIGITPFMSMLRYMRDSRQDSDRNVILIYGNKSESDIVFREELEEMAASKQPPNLSIEYILDNAPDGWKGRRGYLTTALIRELVGDVTTRGCFVCGPPPMMKSVIPSLRSIGVPKNRIRWERFSF